MRERRLLRLATTLPLLSLLALLLLFLLLLISDGACNDITTRTAGGTDAHAEAPYRLSALATRTKQPSLLRRQHDIAATAGPSTPVAASLRSLPVGVLRKKCQYIGVLQLSS